MKNPKMVKSTLSKQKEKFTITEKGSLGLLAYGHKGIQAWREVRDKKEKDGKA